MYQNTEEKYKVMNVSVLGVFLFNIETKYSSNHIEIFLVNITQYYGSYQGLLKFMMKITI